MRVVVKRGGKTETLKVTLGRREEAVANDDGGSENKDDTAPLEKSLLGMNLGELDDARREELGLNPGAAGLVVLSVDETSEAFEKGMRQGDVIAEAAQQDITNLQGFEDMISEARDAGRKSLLLLVRRNGEPRFLALSLDK